jgi:hypothetical protein
MRKSNDLARTRPNALRFVAERGGSLIEGYAKDPAKDFPGASSMWTGIASTFVKAGFTEVERRTPTRPIMRYDLSGRR